MRKIVHSSAEITYYKGKEEDLNPRSVPFDGRKLFALNKKGASVTAKEEGGGS